MPLSPRQGSAIKQLAVTEVEKYGLPTLFHLELSVAKAREIAIALKADEELAVAATYLIDVKLGQAFSENRQPEHVAMGLEELRQLADRLELADADTTTLENAIEAHHGGVPFTSVESEIAANADCYRFVHPAGVIHYVTTLTKRGLSYDKIISTVKAKLDEKRAILSLAYCRSELEEYASSLTMLLDAAAAGEPIIPQKN